MIKKANNFFSFAYSLLSLILQKNVLAKKVLKIEYTLDFSLIAIVSSMKDYRLCWHLNHIFDIHLARLPDMEINRAKQKKLCRFNLFRYEDNRHEVRYFLIDNKSGGDFFLPELKQADYLLMICSENPQMDNSGITEKIKSINEIQTAFVVDAGNIKSKENLVVVKETFNSPPKPKFRKLKHDKL